MRSFDVTVVIGVLCGAIIGALILGPTVPGKGATVSAAESKGPAGVFNQMVQRVRVASPRAS